MKNTVSLAAPGMQRHVLAIRWQRIVPLLLSALLLNGCALFEGKEEKPFLLSPLPKPGQNPDATKGGDATLTPKPETSERKTAYFQTPKPPEAKRTKAGPQPRLAPEAAKDEATTAVNLEGMPIAQFSDAVFGTILKRNVSIDPQIQQRTDLVSLRTGKPQTAEQLFLAAQAVLRSYGVAVSEFQGLVRVVPDKAESGYLPEIRRGRAQPDVPAALRPVFYLVELEHTTAAQAANWLRTLYSGRLTVQDDTPRNALMLSGQSDIVSGAMETLQLLDQPLLRGRVSARITPVFWSAEEMARRLVEILTAEGYSAAVNAGGNTPTLVLPIGAVNSVIVFAGNEQLLHHTLRWAQELDQSPQGKGGGFINYPVRNTNAADLAKTLQEVLGSGPSPAPSTTGAASGSPAAVSSGSKKVVVNAATNSLIIQTTPTDYQQWYGLIQELDRPAKSALIMATVAEVRLTDNEQFGFQWLLDQFQMNGNLVNVGSTGSISAPAAGPRISFANLLGTPRALLSFLASSNKIRILSNPSIIARNGESAIIQVGQEVPILTSQISNANTGSTTGTGILQTIQYRNTGVILKVKPVIHSSGKLDLDVSQEVSAAQVNETGVNSSPVILTRRVETKLTVTDGSTMLLGGLMQENRTSGNAGIPLLKDIPYAGAIFRTSASSVIERTELVILLTPYIMEDNFEASAMTEAFRNQFSWATAVPRPITPLEKLPPPPVSDKPQADAIGDQSILPATDEAKSPQVKAAAPAATGYRSKPYVLPESDGPALTMSTSVVIEQQPRNEAAAPPSTPPPAPASVANSPNAARVESPAGTKPVSDEALRQELLKAIKGGS
jgi:general secretion pathway protein D